jgi:uridine phosphorylase
MKRACPHLLIDPGDIPEAVLLPGDPKRAERIASRLDKMEKVAENREYITYRGVYGTVPVGVISTGVGSPGAAICFEEAIRAGARTLIRVGTAGSIHDDVRAGDLVVILGAVRAEGTTRQLVPLEVPDPVRDERRLILFVLRLERNDVLPRALVRPQALRLARFVVGDDDLFSLASALTASPSPDLTSDVSVLFEGSALGELSLSPPLFL